MKKGKFVFRKICCLLALALFLSPAACAAGEDSFIEFSLAEDIYADGELLSEKECEALSEEIGEMLLEIERLLDPEDEDSDVYRINHAAAGEKVAVSDTTYELLSLSLELHEETAGAFSPMLYALTELWGFSSANEGYYTQPRPEPDEEDIAAALAAADIGNIVLGEDGTVARTDSSPEIDLGGIAKGYMTDRIRAHIEEKYGGDTEYSVSVMSSLFLSGGKHDGDTVRGYRIGLDNPRSAVTGTANALYMADAADCAVSTSADNYRFYVYDGKIYPHIISPETGKPSDNGVISVTVTVPRDEDFCGARADAYSTAGFCMPLTEALAFYETLAGERGVCAVVVTADFQYYVIGEGDISVMSRSEYAAYLGYEGEYTDVFTRGDAATAADEVENCAEEEEYIAYIAGLYDE